MPPVGAAEDHSHHEHMRAMEPDGGNGKRYSRSVERYVVPDVELRDQEGRSTALAPLLNGEHPVALNFIFTSCPSICPVMTATFAQMIRELGGDPADLKTVSVSIDPEYDTPAVLKRYAKQHGASDGWVFLTGSVEEIRATEKAFDTYTGGKMNHRPVALLRAAGAAEWVRIEGLASGGDLASELRALVAN